MQVMGNAMHNREREERAVWKLEQAGYRVRKQARSYLVTISESVTTPRQRVRRSSLQVRASTASGQARPSP